VRLAVLSNSSWEAIRINNPIPINHSILPDPSPTRLELRESGSVIVTALVSKSTLPITRGLTLRIYR
jgi:hypothetical protein